MRNIVEKKWDELEAIWHDLYDKNSTASPFQSYEYLTFTGKGKMYYKDPFRLIGVKELNLVLFDGEEVIAIAPLLIKKKKSKFAVYIRGQFAKASHLDLVYKADWTYEDFKFLMDGIKRLLGDTSFFLDRISEKSVNSTYIKEYFADAHCEEHECFAIPVPQNYDDWYLNLHKSVRRNMVTHKNRLEKDHITYSMKYFIGAPVDSAISKKMMLVFAGRFLIKNKLRFGPFAAFARKVIQLILLQDKLTIWTNNADNNFHAILYMNNEIAAFTSGLISKDRRIILPRLAINTKYAKYGPGGVLISSAIKHLIEQNKKGNLNIEHLDLSQEGWGGMSYKQAYGGRIHINYTVYE